MKYLSKYVDRIKLYVRPHNQRTDLMKLIEEVQYKAVLIVSGCWQGTIRERQYEDLGWESLNERWAHRLYKYGLDRSCLSHHKSEH